MEPIIKLFQTQMQMQQEREVLRATAAVGIHVDKDRLIKALEDARSFWNEGYVVGRAEALGNIVRCKDCKWYRESELLAPNKFCFRLMHPTENRRIGYNFADDDYCSYGERRQDD